MNKKLLALAVGAALSTSFAAQAGTKVYGQLHMSLGQLESTPAAGTGTDSWQVRSHASRFGIKGDRDFGEGLKGIYKIEFAANPDSDNASADAVTGEDNDGTAGIKRRNQYVGLQGDFGTFIIGRHDTPLKKAQGKFDQFGDTDADLKHAGSQDGEHRKDNVLLYKGKAGELGYNIALIPGEGDGTTAGNGLADTSSLSLTYKTGPLYVAVASDTYDDTGAAAGNSNSLSRLVGIYKMGDMQLGLLWQSGVEKVTASADEEDWLGLSFNTKLGEKNKLKAQLVTTEDNATTPTEGTLLGLGLDHKFDKKTTGYVMYSSLEEASGGSTDEETSLAVGLKMKF